MGDMAGHLRIALQLYSVRRDAAADLAGTLERVASLGYEGVEFAGFHGHDPKTIRTWLDGCGLVPCGTHTRLADLEGDAFETTVDAHVILGCDTVIVPGLPEDKRASRDACLRTAEELARIGERLAQRGLRFGYHAHATDFVPLEGGERPWYLIGEATPAEFLLEFDTANALEGGADPVRPLLDFPGRGMLVHLKEWGGRHGGALIGDGEVPWSEVLRACREAAGTRWLVVEHENEELMPAMAAAEGNLRNLRAHLERES